MKRCYECKHLMYLAGYQNWGCWITGDIISMNDRCNNYEKRRISNKKENKIMETTFSETIHTLNERRNNLDTKIKEFCCNVAKAFMKKYKTNQIQFYYDAGEYPTFSMLQMDNNNIDVEVRKIIFNKEGEILQVDGYSYYDAEYVWNAHVNEFYDIDYLELATCINYQLENGQYYDKSSNFKT